MSDWQILDTNGVQNADRKADKNIRKPGSVYFVVFTMLVAKSERKC